MLYHSLGCGFFACFDCMQKARSASKFPDVIPVLKDVIHLWRKEASVVRVPKLFSDLE